MSAYVERGVVVHKNGNEAAGYGDETLMAAHVRASHITASGYGAAIIGTQNEWCALMSMRVCRDDIKLVRVTNRNRWQRKP